MYRVLSDGGVSHGRLKCLSKNKMPLKLKIFLWQAFQGRLQTEVALKKNEMEGGQ
jgi:hypothetical protein